MIKTLEIGLAAGFSLAKRFEHEWIFEAFSDQPSFFPRHMFGGRAAYLEGKIVLCLFENPDDRIWHGALIPTEKEHHLSLLADFPILEPHPILKKWLFLSYEHETFESTLEQISRLIARHDLRFGTIPKVKKKSKKKATKKLKTKKLKIRKSNKKKAKI